MNPEDFTAWDMFWAWVFLIVVASAGIGLGRLLEHFRRKDQR